MAAKAKKMTRTRAGTAAPALRRQKAKVSKSSTKHKKKKTARQNTKMGLKYLDYNLLAVIVFLLCFGLIMLYSASSYEAQTKFGDGMYYLRRQARFSFCGLVLMLWISRYDYHRYGKWSFHIYLGAMFLMALVRFSPLGIEILGSRRWLAIGPFSLQPSEAMKIAVILVIPYILCVIDKKIATWKGLITMVLVCGGVAAFGVYYLTDNLSTAVIVMGIACVMVFVVHPRTKIFVAAVTAAIAVAAAGAYMLGQHLDNSEFFRLRRVLVWLNPEKYESSGGFQTLQSLYAVGSGGLFGKGLGNSVQKTLIPEVQNDYILAVICEEMGIFGMIMVLTLFGLLLYRLLFIAQNAPDRYGSLIATGVFAHVGLQVSLNVMVVLNIIPPTGITLPFISYGGTSVIFLLAEMGIVLGISKKIRLEE